MQCRGSAFQHQPHRRVVGLERGHFAAAHRSGVGVRQQPGFLQHQAVDIGQIFQRRPETALCQPVFRFGVALLRALAEGEQGFGATQPAAGIGDFQHLLRRHIQRTALSFPAGLLRGFAENAIAAEIAAQMSQRDKHLGRKSDGAALAQIAHPPRRIEHRRQAIIIGARQRPRLAVGQGAAGRGLGQRRG